MTYKKTYSGTKKDVLDDIADLKKICYVILVINIVFVLVSFISQQTAKPAAERAAKPAAEQATEQVVKPVQYAAKRDGQVANSNLAGDLHDSPTDELLKYNDIYCYLLKKHMNEENISISRKNRKVVFSDDMCFDLKMLKVYLTNTGVKDKELKKLFKKIKAI